MVRLQRGCIQAEQGGEDLVKHILRLAVGQSERPPVENQSGSLSVV